MVVFACNHCGESLRKQVVQKHYQQKCRGAKKSVSCLDCLKDFYGEEYDKHTKCITEAEKYSGVGYVHKEGKNSQKQESWTGIIASILETEEYNLQPQVRSAFQRLSSHTNVPRKKAKFENFIGNCLRMSKFEATAVWEILEKELDKMKAARALEVEQEKAEREAKKLQKLQNEAKQENGEEEPVEKEKQAERQNGAKRAVAVNGAEAEEAPAKKKRKKIKLEEEQPVAVVTEVGADFNWHDVLTKIVAKHETGITLDKLKKKVRAKYLKQHADGDSDSAQLDAKFEKKFTKRLKKISELEQTPAGLVKLRN